MGVPGSLPANAVPASEDPLNARFQLSQSVQAWTLMVLKARKRLSVGKEDLLAWFRRARWHRAPDRKAQDQQLHLGRGTAKMIVAVPNPTPVLARRRDDEGLLPPPRTNYWLAWPRPRDAAR